jgi:hypothetical protein
MTSFSELGSLWTGPLSDPHRYRVDLHPDGLRAVGNGGEGLVYRASTVSEGRSVDVALKMLTTLTPDDYPRLAERAAALGNVIHPNVMRHLEVFIGCPLVAEDRTPEDEFELVYSAAAWVPGSPLEEGTSEAGPGVGLQWVGQIAEATDYLHRFRGPGAPDGFVHRDIKPSNVRVTPDSRAVLIDFGVARPHSTGDLTEGVGTYLWRAPEIVGGPGTPGKASDVWGVGALAFWAIVGEPPRLEGAELAAAKMREAAGGWDFRDPAALAAHPLPPASWPPTHRPRRLVTGIAGDHLRPSSEALLLARFGASRRARRTRSRRRRGRSCRRLVGCPHGARHGAFHRHPSTTRCLVVAWRERNHSDHVTGLHIEAQHTPDDDRVDEDLEHHVDRGRRFVVRRRGDPASSGIFRHHCSSAGASGDCHSGHEPAGYIADRPECDLTSDQPDVPTDNSCINLVGDPGRRGAHLDELRQCRWKPRCDDPGVHGRSDPVSGPRVSSRGWQHLVVPD